VSDTRPKGYANDLTIKALIRRDIFPTDMSTEYGAKINQTMQWNKAKFSYESQMQLEGVIGYQDQVFDQANVIRISTSQQVKINYLDRKMTREFKLRLYGGFNLAYNPGSSYYNSMGRYSISMFGTAGYQDVFAENYFFNRATVYGVQYTDDMGGFRTGSNNLRMSNYWASTVNATIQLPIQPNMFVAFADFGVYDNGVGVAALYNAGLGINLGDIVGVYFPLVQSVNMGDLYQNYKTSIRLTLRFNPFNLPYKLSTLLK